MEFEGKYKIIYIGTVLLTIILFVLYGIYFIQQGQVKETTQNYNREVSSANETGLGVVLGTSAKEFEEVVQNEALPEELIDEEKIDEEPKEDIVPVKKNSKSKRVVKNDNNTTNDTSNNEVVNEPVVEPVTNYNDEIIDTTIPQPVIIPTPEPTPEPTPVEPEPVVDDVVSGDEE